MKWRDVTRMAGLWLVMSLVACAGAAGDRQQPAAERPQVTAVPEPTATTPVPDLPILGQAPELTNEVWINSAPLTMAGLQGKVVLIEFWTFG